MDPFVSPTHHPLVGLSDETRDPQSGELGGSLVSERGLRLVAPALGQGGLGLAPKLDSSGATRFPCDKGGYEAQPLLR